jgi:hypothetical protein
MKLSSLTLLVAGLALAGGWSSPAPAQESRATAHVEFIKPEKFRDIRLSGMTDARSAETLHYELQRHLNQLARDLLRPGQRLEMAFTDIDLAGEFEPWHGPTNDYRFVRSVYPPRVVFKFRLTDADGKVVNEGTRDIRDMAFDLTQSPIHRNEPAPYVKEILRNFVQRELVTRPRR